MAIEFSEEAQTAMLRVAGWNMVVLVATEGANRCLKDGDEKGAAQFSPVIQWALKMIKEERTQIPEYTIRELFED